MAENVTNDEPDYLGHRERLRRRFLLGGGRDMPDYELLELLLTIAIPRRDVKPLAKELIRKFGSFAEVVNAPLEELMLVKGVKGKYGGGFENCPRMFRQKFVAEPERHGCAGHQRF